jgi:hypothetical protein
MDRVVDLAAGGVCPPPPLHHHDRQRAVVPLSAAAPFVVFLLWPQGNASFLIAIVTLSWWLTAVPHA